MPRIPDQFLQCVIYLYRSRTDAENSVRVGGSGFLLGVPLQRFPERTAVYAVTNRHVIEEAQAPVIRANTITGTLDVLELTPENWFFHPKGDDLAICPFLEPEGKFEISFLFRDQLVTKQIIADYDLGIGDEAFFFGRFINHEGQEQNRPSLRFGNISQMPHEPLRAERGGTIFYQESFLVEGRSIPGYSGSPVFAYITPFGLYMRNAPKIDPRKFFGAWLLGVDWCHLKDYSSIQDETGRKLPLRTVVNSGMMGVIPAWRLDEMLDLPVLKAIREEQEKALLKRPPQAPVTMSGAVGSLEPALSEHSTDENPIHREDFNRLLNVAAKTPRQDD